MKQNCLNELGGRKSKNGKELVGNKAKGRIANRGLKENKVRQISQKTNIFYEGLNVLFWENLTCSVFLPSPFGDCLIFDELEHLERHDYPFKAKSDSERGGFLRKWT